MQIGLLLLPLVFFYINFQWQFSKLHDWRGSFLRAAIVVALWMVLLAEMLSYFRLFDFWGIVLAWFLINIAGIFWIAKKNIEVLIPRFVLPTLSWTEWVIIGGLFVIFLSTFLLGIIAPPNNWDSMTYHMARIGHWIQNESVFHYPTHIVRQLYQPPCAEYIIADLMILTGSDFFANVVQWSAMVGSVVGTSLIAREFKLKRMGQLFTGVLTATIPMGILQSTSTQNDYVLAFFIISTAYFLIDAVQKESWIIGLWGVIAFALAILTKGTAFLYGFPLILIFGIILATKIGKKSINLIMLGTVLIAVICGGHYFRNYQTFGHIFGKPDKGYDYNNREYGYKTIISNGLRNMALHFAVSKRVAKGTELVVKKLFDALQIPWNDPKTTWPASKFSLHPELKTHEDYGGNFCHMLLIIVSVITIFYYLITRKGYDYLVLAYLGVLISMFFIFIGYLKWQPWHSRLHLAMFVFSAPVIAYALVKIEWKWIAFGIIGIMFYQSAPYLYNNMTRPLWGKNSVLKKSREINYFNSRKSIGESYLKLVREIHRQKISKLGLICGKNTWEYPIWKLERNINRQFVLMHAAVGDLSKKYADNEGYNSILKITDKNREVERIDNKEYKMIWHNGKCALYKMKLIL